MSARRSVSITLTLAAAMLVAAQLAAQTKPLGGVDELEGLWKA